MYDLISDSMNVRSCDLNLLANVQSNASPVHQVDQATGCGHQDMTAPLQVS